MPLIKTLARDIQPGDLIYIGGHPVEVLLASVFTSHPDGVIRDTRTVYVCIPSEPGHQLGALPLFDNETYEVERPEPPDPDAELVEVMAEAIRADDNASDGWHETTDSIRADYRSNARAALAAARKAGLL
mgnify:CR=1 FL=1